MVVGGIGVGNREASGEWPVGAGRGRISLEDIGSCEILWIFDLRSASHSHLSIAANDIIVTTSKGSLIVPRHY